VHFGEVLDRQRDAQERGLIARGEALVGRLGRGAGGVVVSPDDGAELVIDAIDFAQAGLE
jgi:hypothetical protein